MEVFLMEPVIKKKKWPKPIKIIIGILIVALSIPLIMYLLQRYGAHMEGQFVPDYPRVTLTEESDYETIFLQTGLGKEAVDKLLKKGDFEEILKAQEAFFNPPEMECTEFLGWFTRMDQIKERGPDLADLQPGDILITLSTHSLGWHHGHAALVIDENTLLESKVLGTDSMLSYNSGWEKYSNYAVLRVKDTTEEQREELVEFARNEMVGHPYTLLAGFIGKKAPDIDESYFGVHCSYLVWYVWNYFGYDLDSDGGRLPTSYDLLHSDKVEIVQVYGMDPRDFIEE